MAETDDLLTQAYSYCRALTAAHGRTYYLAARLLDRRSRESVFALYGFARFVDDIVDEAQPGSSPTWQAEQLDRIELQLRHTLDGADRAPATSAEDLVLLALADTVRRHNIDHGLFWAFLHSMRMDVPGTAAHRDRYETMGQLRTYMYGSAAVIGLQMLPVLGTVAPSAQAEQGAAALGEAFQLTNFLRDIGDDYRRGRIYLPREEISPFGVTEESLGRCVEAGVVDAPLKRALAHLVATNRSVYRDAAAGVPMLAPQARPCIEAALLLYSGILTEIERHDYQVLAGRVVVPTRRKLRVAGPRLARTALTRKRRG